MLISGTIKIFVSDFEKMINFYTDVLGCTLKEKIGKVFARIEQQGLVIEFRPFPVGEARKQQIPTIGIGMSDFDEVVNRLKRYGISFSRFRDEEKSRIVFLHDPEGISIYLRETA